MDWTQVEGNWKQMKGRVKERWGKLTENDLTVIAGRRDQLEGMIQERYGYAKERARKEIDEWYHAMETDLAEQIETLRSGIQSLASTVERIAEEQLPHARSKAREAFNEAEDVLKRNPLAVVAIVLGLGFLIGVFMRR